MTIAILEPFSGISGDMMLGALVHVGLDPAWLEALPARLGLEGVRVRISDVQRGMIACTKVDFDVPAQPHGRHIGEIRTIMSNSELPERVRRRADAAFTAIAEEEGKIHGISIDEVHLHEVGAVDAILDIVGAVWGLSELGVSRVYCGTISMGDGFVKAAHGVLPVPAPATLRLLEGHVVRPGPEGTGELVTPTGAALVKVLSSGPIPSRYVPRRSGYGAGSKDLLGRANALRITLADDDSSSDRGIERLVMLVTDLDDMSPELVAGCAEIMRQAGALDVVLTSTLMKKGRVAVRVEVLVREGSVDEMESLLFEHTTTLGVRRMVVERHSLFRTGVVVDVLGHEVRMKVATLPNGGQRRKPEYDDIWAVARATGRSLGDVSSLALAATERDR
ncbi:MAG: nickel pincer cofactor biosynthesis protein LarC [Gemmatimonadota bacterium]